MYAFCYCSKWGGFSRFVVSIVRIIIGIKNHVIQVNLFFVRVVNIDGNSIKVEKCWEKGFCIFFYLSIGPFVL